MKNFKVVGKDMVEFKDSELEIPKNRISNYI